MSRRIRVSAIAAVGVSMALVAAAGAWVLTNSGPAGAISTNWIVTTTAGTAGIAGSADDTGPAASFDVPRGLAVDATGTIYVADTFNCTIRVVDARGRVTTLAGSAGTSGAVNANGAAARFRYPRAVAVDSSGTVYVADTNNHAVRKIAPNGDVTTLAGTAGSHGSTDAVGADARFFFPAGIAVDASGTVYVADTNNHTIRRISADGTATTLAGVAGEPGGADGIGTARFNHPRGLAVDAARNVYVADYTNNTIRKITPAGLVTTVAGRAGFVGPPYDGPAASARFRQPSGVTIDAAGVIFVADTYNHVVRRILPSGAVSTIAGMSRSPGSADGVGPGARFSAPMAIAAVPASAAVYVSDADDQVLSASNNIVRRLVPGAEDITTPQVSQPTVQLARRRWVTFRGSVTAHDAGATVLLMVEKRVGRRWRAWRTLTVGVAPGASNYALRIRMPNRALYRVRAYHADAAHYPTYSSFRQFRPRA